MLEIHARISFQVFGSTPKTCCRTAHSSASSWAAARGEDLDAMFAKRTAGGIAKTALLQLQQLQPPTTTDRATDSTAWRHHQPNAPQYPRPGNANTPSTVA